MYIKSLVDREIRIKIYNNIAKTDYGYIPCYDFTMCFTKSGEKQFITKEEYYMYNDICNALNLYNEILKMKELNFIEIIK